MSADKSKAASAAAARAHAEERREDYLRALKEELLGAKGVKKADRVKAIEAEIKRVEDTPNLPAGRQVPSKEQAAPSDPPAEPPAAPPAS